MSDAIKLGAYYIMSGVIFIFFYVAWMSPLGNASCTNGLLPCLLPAAEKQFVTNPGITDQNFATEVAVGGILTFWFALPFLFLLMRWLSSARL